MFLIRQLLTDWLNIIAAIEQACYLLISIFGGGTPFSILELLGANGDIHSFI